MKLVNTLYNVKLIKADEIKEERLRALLIQKDVKLYYNVTTDTLRLRALLI